MEQVPRILRPEATRRACCRGVASWLLIAGAAVGCTKADLPSGDIPVWHTGDVPVARVGTVDGSREYQLHRVEDVVRLPDGRIAVANGGSQEIRIYGADGTYVTRLGRAGEGPGEFRSLVAIGNWPGDSLIAFDTQLRRVTVFSPAGVAVRSWHLEPSSRGVFPVHAEVLGDRSVLIRSARGRMPGDPPGLFRGSAPLVRYSANGETLNTIVDLPGDEWYYSADQRLLIDRAFARKGLLAASGTSVFASDAAGSVVVEYRPDGSVSDTIRVASARAVGPADIEAYRQALLQTARNAEDRRKLEAVLAEMPYPETLPGYSALFSDASGRLWVKEYTVERMPTAEWTIFAVSKAVAAKLRLPATFVPMFASDSVVGGIAVDDLGVEYIEVWSLIRQ